MPKQIILNSTSYVPDSNLCAYQFPNPQTFRKGDQIGLSAISIYNSFFNISAKYGNNSFQFTFPGVFPSTTTALSNYVLNSDMTATFTFTIPDGYYAIPDINYFFQQQCILNNLSLIHI